MDWVSKLFCARKREEKEVDEYRGLRERLGGSYDLVINYETPSDEYSIWGALMVYKLTESQARGGTESETIYKKTGWSRSYKSSTQATLIKSDVEKRISAEVKSMVDEILSEKVPEKPRNILINSPGGDSSKVITVSPITPDGGPGEQGKQKPSGMYPTDI